MKDDYRWYNSVKFNQRENLTKNWPEEKERIYNDERMVPFIRYEEESKTKEQMKAGKNGIKIY